MKSVTLHISLNWHVNTGLITLENGLDDKGPESKNSLKQTSLYLEHSWSNSRPTIGRDRVPSHTRGKPQYYALEDLTTGLMEDQKREAPSLPYNFGHQKQAGTCPSSHTNSQHPKRGRTCAYKPVGNPPEVYKFHSRLKFLWFRGLSCDFSYCHLHSEAWSCIFCLFNVFFRGDIKGLILVWRQRGMLSWFGL